MYKHGLKMRRKSILLSQSKIRKTTSACNSSGDQSEGNKTSLRNFNEIPGPKSYSLVGTLYKYLPFIGKYLLTYLPTYPRIPLQSVRFITYP